MRILLEFQLIPSGRNGRNDVLDPKLNENIYIKLVNGKGIHSGPKHLSYVERKGGKSLTHPKLEAAKIEWQVASIPFANRQEYVETRLHVSTQNFQLIREHELEFVNPKNSVVTVLCHKQGPVICRGIPIWYKVLLRAA